MKTLRLIRVHETDLSTFGSICDAQNKSLCVTLEPPLADRLVAGTYTGRRVTGAQDDSFTLDALDDDSILLATGCFTTLLRIGNTPGETANAILVGSNYGTVNGQHGVTGSQAAFRWLMAALSGVDVFELTITDPDPTPVL